MSETTTLVSRPDNVPADRVFDFDIFDVDVKGVEYQLALKKLNDAAVPQPFWTPYNGGHWVVTRADEVDTILNDTDHFSSSQISVPKMEDSVMALKPLQVDPPDHMKYRDLLMGALSPKMVNSLGESARELTISLIEGFKDKGECEFIGEFAKHLPIAIFMKIVDLPEKDRTHLTEIAEEMMRGENDESRGAASMQLAAYGFEKITERRENPGDDLISTIATAKIDGEYLSDGDLAGMIMLLLAAGLDTVASMLGFFAQFLATHEEHRRELIEDPSLIRNAVEELLRRYPIANLGRLIVADVEVGGVTMNKGDMVLAPTALAGLDDRKFENPETVDFHRKKPMHATFGGGVHRCMGAMLARTELRIFIEEWLKRIPDFSIKQGADVKVSARSVATITSLPLVWETK